MITSTVDLPGRTQVKVEEDRKESWHQSLQMTYSRRTVPNTTNGHRILNWSGSWTRDLRGLDHLLLLTRSITVIPQKSRHRFHSTVTKRSVLFGSTTVVSTGYSPFIPKRTVPSLPPKIRRPVRVWVTHDWTVQTVEILVCVLFEVRPGHWSIPDLVSPGGYRMTPPTLKTLLVLA